MSVETETQTLVNGGLESTDARETIAMDKGSIRRIDQDGHLFVEMTPISKANVCPYYGKEIPDFESLGLDPDRVYNLYRDPEELAKAAPSFAGKPLLLIHKPISAGDHPREITIGSLGNDVEFRDPYLMAALNIWDGKAIDLIETEKQKELSSGYRYRADMTPGTVNGESYDGVMRDIGGNHVALVEEGRAGPDVVVGDQAIQTNQENRDMATKPFVLTRKASVAHGAMIAYLRPKLAQDAKIDLKPVFKGVTSKNFVAKHKDIVSGLRKAVSGKLAQDADIEDVVDLLDSLKDIEAEDETEEMPKAGKARDEDPDHKGALREFLKDKLSEDDMKACDELMDAEDGDDDGEKAMDDDETDEERAEREKRDEEAGKDKAKDEEPMVTKKAMDKAIERQVKDVEDRVRKNMRELREAEEDVRPYVGKLAMAHDSAEGVYRTALKALNVNIDGVHPSALKVILHSQPKPNSNVKTAAVAMDSASAKEFAERFPHANRLK